MAANDLNKPLGLAPKRKPVQRTYYWILAGALAVILIAGAVWLILPGTKGPTATAVIATPPPGASTIAPNETTASTRPAAGSLPGLTEVEPSGELSEVGNVVIHDPSDEQPMQLAYLPRENLVEKTADGLLPKMAGDGSRPLDAYARPSATQSGDVRIAIVIGGVGIDPVSTSQAIRDLPGTVTLAFAPYGEHLPESVTNARNAGHELLLQIPLEPFNYPKTNPGPNTLTSNATAAENLDRLHWLLGRFTNYVGVVNYMGARFSGELASMKPVLAEIGSRGLLYLDDGSSARSVAAEAATGMPFLRADLVLDGDLSPAAIDASLRQLQAIARERGYAVGTATAFPVTIERVAAFVKAAAKKGIVIVPVSALAQGRS